MSRIFMPRTVVPHFHVSYFHFSHFQRPHRSHGNGSLIVDANVLHKSTVLSINVFLYTLRSNSIHFGLRWTCSTTCYVFSNKSKKVGVGLKRSRGPQAALELQSSTNAITGVTGVTFYGIGSYDTIDYHRHLLQRRQAQTQSR